MIPQIPGIMGSCAGRAVAKLRLAHRADRGDGLAGAVGILYRKELEHAVHVEARRAELIEESSEQLCNPSRAAERGHRPARGHGGIPL